MTNKEFIKLLESANNPFKTVKLTIEPLRGFKYQISCELTDIVFESYTKIIYLSNAFNNSRPVYGINKLIDILSADPGKSEFLISFEVYAFDGNMDKQLVSVIPNKKNIKIINHNGKDYTEIKVYVEKI